MQILHQCEVRSKLDACEALFGFEDLLGIPFERSTNCQHAIAMRNFLFRIAAIQRLHPEDGGRLVRHPTDLARPGLDASQRHSRRKWQAGHFVDQRTGRVPNLYFFGKFTRRM